MASRIHALSGALGKLQSIRRLPNFCASSFIDMFAVSRTFSKSYQFLVPAGRLYCAPSYGTPPSNSAATTAEIENTIDDNTGVNATASTAGDAVFNSSYTRGQKIRIEVIQFGPLGASVEIVGGTARGLVLQSEIAMLRNKRGGEDVILEEKLDGFVERVREDGRIDVALRPVGKTRAMELRALVLDAIEGSPSGEIPVGDKSRPSEVAAYFHGISKREFKNTVGALYKEGLVKPGLFSTVLVDEDQRDQAKQAAASNLNDEMLNTRGLPKSIPAAVTASATGFTEPRRAAVKGSASSSRGSDNASGLDVTSHSPTVIIGRGTARLGRKARNDDVTLFVGNLPSMVTPLILLNALKKQLMRDCIVDVRIATDDAGESKGYGYIEFNSEEEAHTSLNRLRGFKVVGRALRLDYADPARRQQRLRKAQLQAGDVSADSFSSVAGPASAPTTRDPTRTRVKPSPTPPGTTYHPLNVRMAEGEGKLKGKGKGESGSENANSFDLDAFMLEDSEVEQYLTSQSRTYQDRTGSGTSGSGKTWNSNGSGSSGKAWSRSSGRSSSLSSQGPLRRGRESTKAKGRRSSGHRDQRNGGDFRNTAVCTLRFGNLAYGVNEQMLEMEIEKFTAAAADGRKVVSGVRLARDMDSGRSRGFAYVDFHDRAVADKVGH